MTIAETYREMAPPGIASQQQPTAGQFVDMLNWLAEQPDIAQAPALVNAVKATAWMVEVDCFRQLEDKHLLDGNYDQTLADHRAELSRLIGEGEALDHAIGKAGLATGPIKFTANDLKATLELLHTTFRCEHGPKNSHRTNEQIAQLFDGPKS
jgi:hypothetical protein